jgi:uncharacterized protein (DUF1810 family)
VKGLDRFVAAQHEVWPAPLNELRDGAKRSHWMWFVFPQIAGLGRSDTARYYAIAGRAEAEAYLAHPMLGKNLTEVIDAMLGWAGQKSAEAILGPVDALKLASSMTLFEAAGGGPRFGAMLDGFHAGQRDQRTLDLIG